MQQHHCKFTSNYVLELPKIFNVIPNPSQLCTSYILCYLPRLGISMEGLQAGSETVSNWGLS